MLCTAVQFTAWFFVLKLWHSAFNIVPWACNGNYTSYHNHFALIYILKKNSTCSLNSSLADKRYCRTFLQGHFSVNAMHAANTSDTAILRKTSGYETDCCTVHMIRQQERYGIYFVVTVTNTYKKVNFGWFLSFTYDHYHHHHVPEGLGMFPVPWSSRWSWSLHLFLGRPMFLRPFGLYCSACFCSLCPSSVHVVATFPGTILYFIYYVLCSSFLPNTLILFLI